MPENHQITKRELIEMLEPFDDSDKLAIHVADMQVGSKIETEDLEDGTALVKSKPTRDHARLFVSDVSRSSGQRTTIVINAYEA